MPEVGEDGDASRMDNFYLALDAVGTLLEGVYSRVMGYSSWSMRFLPTFSIMSLSACAGIHVCTKEARLRRGDPSRESSSWMSW